MTKAERKANANLAYAALMKFYPFGLEDLDGEQWKWIPDYEGFYQASTFGRVKSFKQNKPRIMKPKNLCGRLYISLCKNNKPRNFLINRLVALCFIPNTNNLPEVDHVDGHPLNNYVKNLRWVTSKENKQYAAELGLSRILSQGEKHPRAKLNNEQVTLIRENPDSLSQSKLAKIFGVDRATISYIQLGKTYKNAGGTIREKQKPENPLRIPDETREKIRQLRAQGYIGKELAEMFSVNLRTIWKIIRGKR